MMNFEKDYFGKYSFKQLLQISGEVQELDGIHEEKEAPVHILQ